MWVFFFGFMIKSHLWKYDGYTDGRTLFTHVGCFVICLASVDVRFSTKYLLNLRHNPNRQGRTGDPCPTLIIRLGQNLTARSEGMSKTWCTPICGTSPLSSYLKLPPEMQSRSKGSIMPTCIASNVLTSNSSICPPASYLELLMEVSYKKTTDRCQNGNKGCIRSTRSTSSFFFLASFCTRLMFTNLSWFLGYFDYQVQRLI